MVVMRKNLNLAYHISKISLELLLDVQNFFFYFKARDGLFLGSIYSIWGEVRHGWLLD